MPAPFFVLFLVVLIGGCGPRPELPPLLVAELSSPAGPGSMAPSLVRGPEGRVYLSWIEPSGGQSRLSFSELKKDGWADPLEVARGDNWFVNWADIPSLQPLGGGRLAAHWLVRSGPGAYAYDVQLGLSEDDGQSWRPLGRPHDDATETEHGFVSFYPYTASDGRLWPGLVWLDGRMMTGGHAAHDSVEPGAAMTLRHARIRPDFTFGEALVLDERTCDCCQTATVPVADEVLIAYRDRTEGEIRDIRLQRRDGQQWRDAGVLHADGWEISGCPVNGPALDASGDRVAVAWFTAAEDRASVKAGVSLDAGRSFVFFELESGPALGRVDVALLPDGAAVSWLSTDDDGALIRLQFIDADGPVADSPWPLVRTSVSRGSGFPRLIANGEELVLAWTDATSKPSRVRTATVRLQR